MNHRFPASLGAAALLALVFSGCGGSPVTPPPPPPPPANAAPSITGITVQARRAGAPADFANAGDTMDITATVTDAETPVDQLVYAWSAPVGTFNGTGRAVTWVAPSSADAPGPVTITLKVTENYGHPGQAPAFTHEVTRTVTVRLHDSVREVGKMTTDFLEAFSQPQTVKDWQVVMKDFDLNGGTCPDQRQVEGEREDVERHYNNFFMHNYSIGPANVSVGFGQGCAVPGRGVRPGDACVWAPVMWDSTDNRNNQRATTTGTDYVSAAYSTSGSRWFLCSSDFLPTTTFGHSFYSR